MARRFYVQPSDSVKTLCFDGVAEAMVSAKNWSRTVAKGETVSVYKDTGTGFDPVLVRYQRGKLVYDQRRYVG